MSKIRVSMTEITKRRGWKNVYQCGYCELQTVFFAYNPTYYNAGVYGWNCDIYTDFATDTIITTGYRNTRGKKIDRDLIEKYEKKARRILDKEYKNVYRKLDAIHANRKAFFAELNERSANR